MAVRTFTTETELDDALTTPGDALVDDLRQGSGDIVILGAGGKMGPSLARLARAGLDAAGRDGDRVVAVSRFSDPRHREELERHGITVMPFDLVEHDDLSVLPDAPNVIHMVGAKFGADRNQSWAWEVNAALPGRIARRYRDSRIVAMSTGNVYPFVSPATGGATEDTPPDPVGEYAQSCLGRERVFQFAAATWGTALSVIRLNYAVDLRYGVLADLATQIMADQPVPLHTGSVNIVWQGYANEVILRSLGHADAEVFTLNLTGTELLEVRRIATRLADLLGHQVHFDGEPEPTALLSDATRCRELFGPSPVDADQLIEWQAAWVRDGLPMTAKPTKWAVRDGKF
ncbi:NAD(P)-dependent oxidoreductase [Arachnia propionica]|uniref:NAD(P)-dependent oxidoreductase n=1 Tax=Arachnia propionica TaxID=1750 RepID=A0A3P1T495_9ACTN|nr:NAD(P)-dependent oxidoreductase [Arachnia propionica]MDO5083197.1 NAD(P)-dependent oxidoreductase [Arachnia propionica]RRD04124.1 NAD(P)-dependent oxidoreductase [Arachnia propionica]